MGWKVNNFILYTKTKYETNCCYAVILITNEYFIEGSTKLPRNRMQQKDYQDIKSYLTQNILPKTFSSTKSNFKKLASRFEVVNNELRINGLQIVLYKDRKKIFDEFHQVI